MTDHEILEKAFKKANKNGANIRGNINSKKIGILYFLEQRYYNVIFCHSFAKAFWGDNSDKSSFYVDGGGNVLEDWEYHLQQMVVEKEPLKYLEKFL